MTSLSATGVPVDLLAPPPGAPQAPGSQLASPEKRAAIGQAAQSFEASFLSTMLGEMFEGVSTDGPFGGGQGEEMFRSLMVDQYAKGLTARGGFGLAAHMQSELMKHQQVQVAQ